MGDGFLDEVEKAIDNFSPNKEEKINKKVEIFDYWQNYHDSRRGEREATFQRLMMGTAPMALQREKERVDHISCDCGVHIIATIVVDMSNWARSNISNEYVGNYVDYDTMYCPRCSKMYKILGKIKDLKVMMRN